jgi:hypothetical protein
MDELEKDILKGAKSFARIISLLFLCCGFLGLGMLKLVGYEPILDEFAKWFYPSWFVYVVGFIEIVLALALFYAPTRKKAILLAAVLMLSALTTHAMYGEYDSFAGPVFMLVLLAILWKSE